MSVVINWDGESEWGCFRYRHSFECLVVVVGGGQIYPLSRPHTGRDPGKPLMSYETYKGRTLCKIVHKPNTPVAHLFITSWFTLIIILSILSLP